MQRSVSVLRKPAVKMDRVIDQVTLDHEGRHKRRIVLNGEKGTTFLLDLEKATVLNDGDALKLEDGGLVLVKAAAETLLEIKADNPLRLLKMAWHIGNRHTPAEITADALYIQDDHVLAEMVRGQGCQIAHVARPFQPEAGAYAHDHAAHSHAGHEHDHAGGCCGGHHHHDHGHAHSHAHDHGHDHAHGAGSSCGCGHSHDHHSHDHHSHDHHSHDHHQHAHHKHD